MPIPADADELPEEPEHLLPHFQASVYRPIPRYRLELQRFPPAARLVYRQSIEHDQQRGVAVDCDLLGADGTANWIIWKRNVGVQHPLSSTAMDCKRSGGRLICKTVVCVRNFTSQKLSSDLHHFQASFNSYRHY
jgi:hypothetical protein